MCVHVGVDVSYVENYIHTQVLLLTPISVAETESEFAQCQLSNEKQFRTFITDH